MCLVIFNNRTSLIGIVISCLERLPSVIKPLIDVVVEATGCLVSVYVGGPEPADGGRLHISSYVIFLSSLLCYSQWEPDSTVAKH